MDWVTNAEKEKHNLSAGKWRGYRMTYHKMESRKQDTWSEVEGLAGMNYEATGSIDDLPGNNGIGNLCVGI
jgi:hypothetical protein